MKFTPLDASNRHKAKELESFAGNSHVSFSTTVTLDITTLYSKLEKKEMGIYSALTYCISSIINSHEDFRTTYNNENKIGVWDGLIPSYTIFNEDAEKFGTIWTEFDKDFSVFNTLYLQDIKEYNMVPSPNPKPNQPPNTFLISTLPWIDFTAYSISGKEKTNCLLPSVTLGRVDSKNSTTFVPMAVHAYLSVCDGYRVGRFISEMRQMCQAPESWLI